MPSYKTKSIILKSYNLGEADRIIKLYSQDKGLIDAVAKGARKIKSKFGGRLELYNFIECELSKGRNLDIINQAEIIKTFKNIPGDFNKFLFCQLISEIILKTNLAGAENAPVLFKLIYVCFSEIDTIPEGDIYSIEKTGVFFISKFLKITGYAPLVHSCTKCGNQTGMGMEEGNIFSIRLGGILCRQCAAEVANYPDLKKLISKEQHYFIIKLFSATFKDFRAVNMSPEDLNDVCRLIGEYMRYHTDCNIDIPNYLNRILP